MCLYFIYIYIIIGVCAWIDIDCCPKFIVLFVELDNGVRDYVVLLYIFAVRVNDFA